MRAAVGIEAPTNLHGVEQLPIDGTSLAYTFDAPLAPVRKRVQYFELMGNRGIWADGWKAVSRHLQGTDFAQDRWELYHLDADFSESEDLAERHPAKLRELVARWEAEAARNHVYPLDDRDRERGALTYWDRPRVRWQYEQGMTRVSGYAAPAIGNRSYRIEAEVDLAATTEGVILAVGGRPGGYVLFVQHGCLVYEYIGPARRRVAGNWRSSSARPGPAPASARCAATGRRWGRSR